MKPFPAPAAAYVRSVLHRRWAPFLALAVLVAVGTGAALGALVLAHRTDRAHPDYVRTAGVNQLVVNPGLTTDAVGDAIRSLPGVTSVHSDDLLLASVTSLDGARVVDLLTDGSANWLQVHAPRDGRFREVDRPIVTEGRLPDGEEEVFVSTDYRATLEEHLGRPVEIGSPVDVAFYPGRNTLPSVDETGSPVEVPLDQTTLPLGVEELRVVGFGRLSDEVLPDALYPREQVLVSRDVADRYACRFDVDSSTTRDELFDEHLSSCATRYRYYSLDLEPGSSLDEVRASFDALAADLNAELPDWSRGNEFAYFFVSQDRTDLDEAVERTTTPVVWALRAFGLTAGIATVVIALLATIRLVRRSAPDLDSLRALGAPTWTRIVAGSGAPVVAMVSGLVVGVGIAWLVSGTGAVGSVQRVLPSPTPSLPLAVVGPAVAVLGVTMLGGVVLTTWQVVRRRSRSGPAAERALPGWLAPTSARGSGAILGVRAALGTRRSDPTGAVLVGGVVAVTVTVAAVVFGTNLAAVTDAPARYGWPWSVGVLTGSGYNDAVAAEVESTLAGRPEVASVDYYAFDPAASFDGSLVPTVLGLAGSEQSPFTIVEGRPTERVGDVVLGVATADQLGVEIGDEVTVSSQFSGAGEPVRAVVVGTAVMPSVGPFLADRSGLGVGAFLPTGVDPALGTPAAMVAIDLSDGADPQAFVSSIGDRTASWDSSGARPVVLDRPAVPAELVDITDMRGAPLLLAGILAAALAVGLALSIAVSVRDRERDLAILRSLGMRSRELRSTVRWQTLTIVGAGVVIGTPLGIVLGRIAWRRFADQLGLAPDVVIPWAWLLVVALAALVLGLLAALVPGRFAARVRPAAVLRRP